MSVSLRTLFRRRRWRHGVMELDDRPGLRRALVDVTLPSFRRDRLSVRELAGELPIEHQPGRVACDVNRDVARLKIPFSESLLQEVDVEVGADAVPALKAAERRHDV